MRLLLLFTALNFVWLFEYGHPDWKPLLVGLSGLAAAGRRAAGHRQFISTLTRNQIIAGVVTFVVCLLLWVLEWVSGYDSSAWARVLAYISVTVISNPSSRDCFPRRTWFIT